VWGVNCNHTPSTVLFVEPPAGGAGKGTKALKVTARPAPSGAGFSHGFLSQGTFHRDSRVAGQNNGDEYWGFMIYLPTDWTWGWTGQFPNWGSVMFEANYPPFITPNGPFRLNLEPGGFDGDGTGTIRAQIKGGYGEQPQWQFGMVTTTYSGNMKYQTNPNYPSQTTFSGFPALNGGMEPLLKVIPQGEFTKGVWHQIIVHVRWTVGIEQGGVSPMWRTWWKRKGENTGGTAGLGNGWNLTINMSGADHVNPNRAASLLWGIDGDSRVWTPDMYLPTGPTPPSNERTVNGVRRISTYSNFSGYYVSSLATGTHPFWVDNMVNGDSFEAISSRMP
jgi:hypothetical protein